MKLPFLIWLLSEKFMLPCISKQVFGIDCPGCGLQRSVALLLRGEFQASFLMYPGLFPMMALFGFLALNRFVSFRRANEITILLAGTTVLTILTNFFIKIIH
ncbi:MAG: DUF2752 domain-containing protein [Robiginitalea sp.]